MKKNFFLIVLFLMLTVCVSCADDTVPRSSTAKVPNSAAKYEGRDISEVCLELKELGFSNIQIEKLNDLTSQSSVKDGSIETIKIDGDSAFVAKNEFEKNSLVYITYHNIPRIKVPFDSKEVVDLGAEDVNCLLSDVGFTNITCITEYDIDPDESTGMTEIRLGNNNTFDSNEEYIFDGPITIVTHLPFDKYSFTLNIQFNSNLLLNKFGVDVYIDNQKQTSLDHGEDKEISVQLKQGDHTVLITKAGDDSVKGQFSFTISCNSNAKYSVTTHSDYIEIEKIYFDNLSELLPNQARVLYTSDSLKNNDYLAVKSYFESLGFLNIELSPIYDIVWGITTEGSVESVSIDDSTVYIRGDIFDVSVKVVISYHLKEKDKPVTLTPTSTPAPVSYSTNTKETVKNGNSGVYAYIKDGQYQNYIIIDFDEGYVYMFQDGNGSDFCERLKIDEGDLNTRVIVTFHEDGMTWNNGLHFKWVNQPDTLILQDPNWEFEFKTTNLEKALKIRDTKNMIDY